MKILYARVEHPDNCFEQYKYAINKLYKDRFYEVKRVAMGQSSTSIMLDSAEVRIWLSAASFEFYLKDKDGSYIQHNIYNDKDYNPYLTGLREKI